MTLVFLLTKYYLKLTKALINFIQAIKYTEDAAAAKVTVARPTAQV